MPEFISELLLGLYGEKPGLDLESELNELLLGLYREKCLNLESELTIKKSEIRRLEGVLADSVSLSSEHQKELEDVRVDHAVVLESKEKKIAELKGELAGSISAMMVLEEKENEAQFASSMVLEEKENKTMVLEEKENKFQASMARLVASHELEMKELAARVKAETNKVKQSIHT